MALKCTKIQAHLELHMCLFSLVYVTTQKKIRKMHSEVLTLFQGSKISDLIIFPFVFKIFSNA